MWLWFLVVRSADSCRSRWWSTRDFNARGGGSGAGGEARRVAVGSSLEGVQW